MKEYTTLEALKALTENPKLVFYNVNCHNRMGFDTSVDVIGWLDDDGGSYEGDIPLCGTFLKYKWTIAEQPVSFMEAANSKEQIKAEGWLGYEPIGVALSILSSNSYADLQTMLNTINGKWYIKEEE